jgi:hypothetical protein
VTAFARYAEAAVFLLTRQQALPDAATINSLGKVEVARAARRTASDVASPMKCGCTAGIQQHLILSQNTICLPSGSWAAAVPCNFLSDVGHSQPGHFLGDCAVGTGLKSFMSFREHRMTRGIPNGFFGHIESLG